MALEAEAGRTRLPELDVAPFLGLVAVYCGHVVERAHASIWLWNEAITMCAFCLLGVLLRRRFGRFGLAVPGLWLGAAVALGLAWLTCDLNQDPFRFLQAVVILAAGQGHPRWFPFAAVAGTLGVLLLAEALRGGRGRSREGAAAGKPVRRVALLVLLAGCSSGKSTPPTPAGFEVVTEVDGLGQVTDLAFLPDGRMVITEKGGTVRLRAAAPPHALTVAGTFSVDTASEKGLLGVVVPPSFGTDGRIVLYRSLSDAAGGTDLDRHHVASFVLRGDGTLDPNSERMLVGGLRGPANHDGGGMAFGPDGKLYVGVGDTGCNATPDPPRPPGNFFATCLTNANGKILRVAVEGPVPADNPLVGVPAVTACGDVCGAAPTGTGAPRTEIWAWGLRNPWRFAFDPGTGLLWVADVGEASYEEVDVVQAGKHHGWPWREGRHGWPVDQCRTVVPDAGDCVDPVYECRHGAAAGGIDGDCEAITGGSFLTGPRWPAALRDRYLFGDSGTQFLWTVQLTPDRRGVVPGSRQVIAQLSGPPVSIRTGPDGDLYVALLSGQILRVTPR